jgi:hypothetical protein
MCPCDLRHLGKVGLFPKLWTFFDSPTRAEKSPKKSYLTLYTNMLASSMDHEAAPFRSAKPRRVESKKVPWVRRLSLFNPGTNAGDFFSKGKNKMSKTKFYARVVAQDNIGEFLVSTIFIGLDHSFRNQGPPLIFETMVLKDGESLSCDRCSTWAEAEAQHAKAVAAVKNPLTAAEQDAYDRL